MAAKAESHEFKAEIRQLLDLMIHSLYSNKEIFLRELISNASDALDRLRFESQTNPDLIKDSGKPEIRLETNTKKRTLTIHDNGIGMSRQELIDNIGTIAHSGWREILNQLRAGSAKEIPPEFIGQFGVGFYSCFMASKKVSLVTRRAGEDTATRWESAGDGTYKLTETKKKTCGTSITLYLKPVDSDNGLEDFTNEWTLGGIVKKYSDFVTYPIILKVLREKFEEDEKGEPKKDGPKKTVEEERTLNSMKALWERNQSEVKQSEYNDFYRHISHDWNEPLKVITQRAEGRVLYNAMLFVPSKAPDELYYQAFEAGLQLYVKNVKIIEKCQELLPRFLRFVRGVVDSPDLPLNVSREMLQHNREIVFIKKAVTKKVMDALETMHEKDRDDYVKFWGQFGRALKEGVQDSDHQDRVMKLLLFESSNHPTKMTSLSEYVSRMKEDQKEIYYITGESRAIVENMPVLETLKEKGVEVLYFLEPVDEYMVQFLHSFEDKRFKSAFKGVVDLGDKKEKEEAQKKRDEEQKQYADLFTLLQKKLDEYVKQVRLSGRLAKSAVCLVGTEIDYSPQMEKLLLKGNGGGEKQRRIMEINPSHPLLGLMQNRFEQNKEDPIFADYAELLYGQGLLSEGTELPNPVKFSQQVANLMVQTLDKTNSGDIHVPPEIVANNECTDPSAEKKADENRPS